MRQLPRRLMHPARGGLLMDEPLPAASVPWLVTPVLADTPAATKLVRGEDQRRHRAYILVGLRCAACGQPTVAQVAMGYRTADAARWLRAASRCLHPTA